MAVTTSVDTLWARALDYADMTGSSFPDSNRKYDLVNVAIAELHSILANTGAEYFCTHKDQAVTAGTAEYDLPDDFYKLRKVYWSENSRLWLMRQYSDESADGMLTAPTTSGTVHYKYVPRVQRTSVTPGTTDIIDTRQYPLGWEDYVALTVAIRLLVREESDASQLRHERDRLQKLIGECAEPRDIGEPHMVDDVYGRWHDSWWKEIAGPATRNLRYRVEGLKLRIMEIDTEGL